MHKMEELKEMLCDELEEITSEGKLTAGDLDTVDKLTHSIKSIETIMAMGGYSNTYYRDNDGRNSYARRMMQELRELMEDAETEQERNAISRCIKEMNV